ncbi:hypothetical protein CSHISOI_04314 [Colletotrichum shisoi]|uniref:Uncharacterized protein n=1 Tax=Colletotrichum shisoi TaxID=2078593 RepID=A0A5Q4BVN2_9PEZI|nr:hypothetical protein CSHISOI_04314 [Colletotrichum shisoi]
MYPREGGCCMHARLLGARAQDGGSDAALLHLPAAMTMTFVSTQRQMPRYLLWSRLCPVRKSHGGAVHSMSRWGGREERERERER